MAFDFKRALYRCVSAHDAVPIVYTVLQCQLTELSVCELAEVSHLPGANLSTDSASLCLVIVALRLFQPSLKFGSLKALR